MTFDQLKGHQEDDKQQKSGFVRNGSNESQFTPPTRMQQQMLACTVAKAPPPPYTTRATSRAESSPGRTKWLPSDTPTAPRAKEAIWLI